MLLQERYVARSIGFLELWQCGDWRLKLYGLAYRAGSPDADLVAAAKRHVAPRLPRPAVTKERYGVGFIGVHHGRDSNLVFVGWWANENELYQHVWTASPPDSGSFVAVTPSGLTGCVWDLAVIGFERQAWIETVLAPPRPDTGAYLGRRFAGMV